ncbi:uncharacterized protein [Procambarus clarkii]|uniref:uncharacterized protein isoform X2 n=1 Tax=Procambarus clarkii TaxID=6728 RepID=UPI0037437F54
MWDGTRFFSSKAKMGSLVIAVFLLVFGVWLIECSDLETLNKTIQEAVPELCLERETFKHCREYITTFATVIMAVGLVEGVFEIIVGGLLIYGILKVENYKFVPVYRGLSSPNHPCTLLASKTVKFRTIKY